MENDNAKFKMSDNFTFLTVILIFDIYTFHFSMLSFYPLVY